MSPQRFVWVAVLAVVAALIGLGPVAAVGQHTGSERAASAYGYDAPVHTRPYVPGLGGLSLGQMQPDDALAVPARNLADERGASTTPSPGRVATEAAGHPTFEPGPYAGESIPARSSSQTFNSAERANINRIGSDTGCHTCGATEAGTKSGSFVPDHQPVSALNTKGLPQQLYPHCIACSREQGLAVARALGGLQ